MRNFLGHIPHKKMEHLVNLLKYFLQFDRSFCP